MTLQRSVVVMSLEKFVMTKRVTKHIYQLKRVINNMHKQAIKELLMKFTDPKPQYDGITADELARLILIAINDPENENNKPNA